MEERSLKVLEFDKIIARLAECASSDAGRQLCLRLKPSSDRRLILRWQKNTSDAAERIRLKGAALSFHGVKDISEALKRLEVNASLSIPELLAVSAVLTVAERAKAYGCSEEEERQDSLSEDFSLLEPLTRVNRELKRCILSEEELADDASPGLYDVRRKIRQIGDKIHDTMSSLLNSCRDYLTDAVITQRDGAYCLPVRAEYKSKLPGIVQDTSSTGLTLFIVPMAVVKLNNELKELEAAERKEVEEVLRTLSLSLSEHTDDIRDDLGILRRLDMIFAKAIFAGHMDANEPEFSKDRSLDLIKARHPLLDSRTVVPVGIRLGKEFDQLIITGPNTGGKTVALKTAGLLSLMGQAGLHIPAAPGSVLGIFDEIYADIGDEQSIEQSLSTFSAHMTNIVHILEKADAASLCLFDELGSGTDPEEGAALGMAILSFLHRMQTRTIATTHYSEIKMYALNTPGVENACCEFDVATLRPTYRLLIGMPGRSNAFAISKRLGLPEDIIEEARGYLSAGDQSFDAVIGRLNDERQRLEESREKAEDYGREIEVLRARLKKKEATLEENREKLLRQAREDARKILKEAKETADEAIRNINKISAEGGRSAEAERDRLRKSLKAAEEAGGVKVKGPSKRVSPRKLAVGDTVKLSSMGGNTGTVSSLPDRDGYLFVQMGILKTKVHVSELEQTEQPAAEAPKVTVRSSFSPKALDIRPELNLIGMTTDEALPMLEKYLDDAYLAHLPSVRIVHGRGTGALKNMVQQRLRKLKYVKSFRLGEFGEGDSGVTVVTFR